MPLLSHTHIWMLLHTNGLLRPPWWIQSRLVWKSYSQASKSHKNKPPSHHPTSPTKKEPNNRCLGPFVGWLVKIGSTWTEEWISACLQLASKLTQIYRLCLMKIPLPSPLPPKKMFESFCCEIWVNLNGRMNFSISTIRINTNKGHFRWGSKVQAPMK